MEAEESLDFITESPYISRGEATSAGEDKIETGERLDGGRPLFPLPIEPRFEAGGARRRAAQMAIAAVAHVFVFPVDPYKYLPISDYGKITSLETKTTLKVNDKDDGKPVIVEENEKHIEAPGTSVTESVQDVVLGGGGHVVKDVVLTISQAIEPVEKGVTNIKEKFHKKSAGSDEDEDASPKVTVKVTKHVKECFEEGDKQKVVSKKEEISVEPVDRAS